jgi:hypothetical protein
VNPLSFAGLSRERQCRDHEFNYVPKHDIIPSSANAGKYCELSHRESTVTKLKQDNRRPLSGHVDRRPGLTAAAHQKFGNKLPLQELHLIQGQESLEPVLFQLFATSRRRWSECCCESELYLLQSLRGLLFPEHMDWTP